MELGEPIDGDSHSSRSQEPAPGERHERRLVDPEDGEITTSFDDQVVGTALTAGVGFVTDSFVFDLSMEYGGWRQQVIRFDSDGTDFQEFKTRRLTLKTSLVIYF